MSKLSAAEVQRISKLAHIGLSEAEVAHMAGELEVIVSFVEQLQAVNVDGVEPTDQVTGLVDVMREDVVAPSMDRTLALSNAPAQLSGYIKVKRVLNG
ncbi:Asp-tRNA(Asn)/Glu-tRNA(Gln) amidotransferase subunit GatC [Candidatus Saccharibacteria bacterium]|nr:Asp-tRNA(Asn)/Glu-tRNA(Gln) amidotransferase subunit GatC [Candidatus Saccharibacteria bacterium]